MSNDIIQAAMQYASFGWRVMPVDPSTKHPPLKEWQKLATTDEDLIVEWWTGPHKNCGVGVQFGPTSGIVDIEIDDAAADAMLREAFGGEIPPTPTFDSAKGLPHRIFKYRSDLPNKANLSLKPYGIAGDFKIGFEDRGSQSVFPPSRGRKWRQGLEPSSIEPAEIPNQFIAWLDNSALEGKRSKKSGTGDAILDGQRNSTLASLAGSMRRRGMSEGAITAALIAENDAKCSPPLPISEVENIARSIAGYPAGGGDLASVVGNVARAWPDLESGRADILRFALLQNGQNTSPLPENEVKDVVTSIVGKERARRAGELLELPGGQGLECWLVVIIAEPRRYELHCERFVVVLTGDQLSSYPKVRVALLEQANYVVPSGAKFTKAWTQEGGLLARLMATADFREPPREERRRVVIAQRLMEFLEQAKPSTTGEPRGIGCHKLEDGAIVFRFNAVLEAITVTGNVDQLKRQELSAMLTECGMVEYRPRAAEGRPKYKRLPAAGVERLAEEAYGGVSGPFSI